MRNIFLLLRRYAIFLLFITLQVVSITLLVKYNSSQQAKYMQVAYELTGRINRQYSAVTGFFALGETNRQLAAENERLRNLLGQNFTFIDSAATLRTDTTFKDSTRLIRKYLWRTARVVNNSVAMQNNYITLERGRLQGIERDMAVMGPAGIVGLVTDVSDNMSIVMSLLHRKCSTSVMLKNSRITGILDWDGKSPAFLQLRGIPKSSGAQVGDTILTSNISINFPSGLMVGTIAEIDKETGDNNFKIQVKPATNFYTLQFVDVIDNLFLKEQTELEQKAKRQQ
ncbi:MAG TPA: rod shape-determining protein MreC [Phnomibacter sp.]|nr:rod shape-determining protein MreC [Phnomibacter sp.]